MPNYDVECVVCGFAGTVPIKLADLETWDSDKVCPRCNCRTAEYRRVISSSGNAKPARRGSRTGKSPAHQMSPVTRDEMMHANLKYRNEDKIEAAVESVRSGEFEGFK